MANGIDKIPRRIDDRAVWRWLTATFFGTTMFFAGVVIGDSLTSAAVAAQLAEHTSAEGSHGRQVQINENVERRVTQLERMQAQLIGKMDDALQSLARIEQRQER